MRIVHGGTRLTLRACSGTRRNTAWSGGFEIDYIEAPEKGRWARRIIRIPDLYSSRLG